MFARSARLGNGVRQLLPLLRRLAVAVPWVATARWSEPRRTLPARLALLAPGALLKEPAALKFAQPVKQGSGAQQREPSHRAHVAAAPLAAGTQMLALPLRIPALRAALGSTALLKQQHQSQPVCHVELARTNLSGLPPTKICAFNAPWGISATPKVLPAAATAPKAPMVTSLD